MLEPALVKNLLAGGWRDLAFEPFRPGVEVHWLKRDGVGASAALLRYEPGASVPLHEHAGFEIALILDGAQEDESRDYPEGTLAIQSSGTRHKISSESGCVALLFWERPVQMLE